MPEELNKRKEEWQERGKNSESHGCFDYIVTSAEEDRGSLPLDQEKIKFVDTVHDTSFIRDVIPEMIKQKNSGEKVRVLDLGAGVGLYADQIRRTFHDQVIVYSTGISKKTRKNLEKNASTANSTLQI